MKLKIHILLFRRLILCFAAIIIASCANNYFLKKRPQFKTSCLGVSKFEYIEDEYKIAIFSDNISDYNEFNKYIKSQINLIPEIELINPTWEGEKKNIIGENINVFSKYLKDPYPEFTDENDANLGFELLPLSNGGNTMINYDFASKISSSSKFPYYVRRRNGKKFKRSNDDNLKKIQSIPGIISAMVIYNNYGPNLKNYIMYNRRIDSSKVFFYPKEKPHFDLLGFDLTTYPTTYFIFFTDRISLTKGKDFTTHSAPNIIEAKVDKGTGFGIVDIYEKLLCPYNIYEIGILNLSPEKWELILYGKGLEK